MSMHMRSRSSKCCAVKMPDRVPRMYNRLSVRMCQSKRSCTSLTGIMTGVQRDGMPLLLSARDDARNQEIFSPVFFFQIEKLFEHSNGETVHVGCLELWQYSLAIVQGRCSKTWQNCEDGY